MNLTTETRHDRLTASWTAPTVTDPDQVLDVELSLFRPESTTVVITRIDWDLPDALAEIPGPPDESPFPITLGAEPVSRTFSFRSADETYGEMGAILHLDDGTDVALENIWISVFEAREESNPAGLSDVGRRRLVAVVNARTRNGHIFLADYAAFFADFLNIAVSESIGRRIDEEMGLDSEEVPLDEERRRLIIQGKMTFYGIVDIKLDNEEDCVEDDLRPIDVTSQRELPEEDIEQDV